MRALLRRKRGIAAFACLALVAVIALAPVASAAFTCVLAIVPALFALVTTGPAPQPPVALFVGVLDSSPLVPRGPPAA